MKFIIFVLMTFEKFPISEFQFTSKYYYVLYFDY